MRLHTNVYDYDILDTWDISSGQHRRLWTAPEPSINASRPIAAWPAQNATLLAHAHGENTPGGTPYGNNFLQVLNLADGTDYQYTDATGTKRPAFAFHGGPVTSVAYSSDGQTLATASIDSTVKLWRASDGALLGTLTQSTGIQYVAFSPDGHRLVATGGHNVFSGSNPSTPSVWDITNPAAPVLLYTLNTSCTQAAFSPDGTRIATMGFNQETLSLFNASDGTLLASTPVGDSTTDGLNGAFAFSPDGTQIVAGGLASYASALFVGLYDSTTLTLLRSAVEPVDSGNVYHVAFSADGSHIGVAVDYSSLTVLRTSELTGWNTRTSGGLNRGIAFDPSGQYVLDAPAPVMEIRRVSDGTVVQTYDQETGSGILDLTYSPDGKTFAYARLDNGVAVANNPFYQPPLAISGFSPASGPVGTVITLSGSALTGATGVKFNGTTATFQVNTASQITATVPTGATTGTISVTTPLGMATSATNFTVTAGTPTANGQSGVSVPFNTARAITLSGSDPDVPALPLTYTVVTGPTHGTLTGTAPSVSYTPTTGYAGPDGFTFTFTFTVSNGTNTSAPANVSLTVNPAPQPPVTLYALSYQGTYYFLTASQSQEAGLVANGWTGGPTGLVYAHSTDAPGLTPLFQLFYPSTSDHFYTTDPNQRASLISAGWQDKGIACYVYTTQVSGTVPLDKAYNSQTMQHQFTGSAAQYNALSSPWGKYGPAAYILPLPAGQPVTLYALSYQGKYFFLTDSASQEAGLVANGWAGGPTGHVYANSTDAPGIVPLFQLFYPSTQDHFYTTDPSQRASLISAGWQDKGICCYAYTTSVSGTVPLNKAYNSQTMQHQFTGNAAQYNALSSPWGKYGPAAYLLP